MLQFFVQEKQQVAARCSAALQLRSINLYRCSDPATITCNALQRLPAMACNLLKLLKKAVAASKLRHEPESLGIINFAVAAQHTPPTEGVCGGLGVSTLTPLQSGLGSRARGGKKMKKLEISDWAMTGQNNERYQAELEEAKKRVLVKDGAIHITGDYEYEVPVGDCQDMVDMCRWLFHLADKSWMTEAMLRRFAKLMCEAQGLGNAGDMPWWG